MLLRARTLARSRPVLSLRSSRHYSWEPLAIVGVLTESFQAVHAYSGVPWWALIPLTTFTLRSIWTLPLAIMQRRRIQKQNELRPIVSAMGPVTRLNLAKKAQQARAKAKEAKAKIEANDQDTKSDKANYAAILSPLASMKYEEIMLLSAREVRKRQKALFKEHDAQLYKNMLLPAFQIPLWVCMSLAMRDLSGWSTWESVKNKPLDADLYTQGIAWFQDLTISDPMHVLPVAIGIVALCNVEWTVKSFQLAQNSPRKTLRPTVTDSMANLSRMMIVFLMAASLHAPAALSIYWLSSQVFSLIQNIFLDLAMPLGFSPRKRFAQPKATLLQKLIDVINTAN